MASSEPLVCASLHLPPDIQPFLRIHQVAFEIFLPNIDHLRLTLVATQDVCPEASQIFFETRKILREQLERVFRVLLSCQILAERYLKLLEAVSKMKPTQDPLSRVNSATWGGIRCSTEAQEAMTKFWSELEGAVGRVSTAMSAKYKSSGVSLSFPENAQLVFEIIGGVDECNALLQQCHNQFENLRKVTEDEDSIESNPPTADEIQVIWQTLSNNIDGLSSHGNMIAQEIQLPSRDNIENTSGTHKAEKSVSLWTLFQRGDRQDAVHSPNTLKVLETRSDTTAIRATPPTRLHVMWRNGASATEAPGGVAPSTKPEVPKTATTNGAIPNHPQIAFWRKILRSKGNSSGSADVSGTQGPKASKGAPHLLFWRKFLPDHASRRNRFDEIRMH